MGQKKSHTLCDGRLIAIDEYLTKDVPVKELIKWLKECKQFVWITRSGKRLCAKRDSLTITFWSHGDRKAKFTRIFVDGQPVDLGVDLSECRVKVNPGADVPIEHKPQRLSYAKLPRTQRRTRMIDNLHEI